MRRKHCQIVADRRSFRHPAGLVEIFAGGKLLVRLSDVLVGGNSLVDLTDGLAGVKSLVALSAIGDVCATGLSPRHGRCDELASVSQFELSKTRLGRTGLMAVVHSTNPKKPLSKAVE